MDRKLKVLIVDDEQEGHSRLKTLLYEHFPDFEIVSGHKTLEDAKAAIQIHNPDIIFLDIEFENGSGFKLLNAFPERERNFEVIITTAQQEYALSAIKASALDYILKPVSVEALHNAIKKFWAEYNKKNGSKAKTLIDAWGDNFNDIKQVALPTLEGYLIVETADILYAEADGSYTTFHLKNKKKPIVSRNLKEYDELLKHSGFFRIHHSLLVNLSHVNKYTRGKSGCVELSDGTLLEVAFRRRDDFLKVLSSL